MTATTYTHAPGSRPNVSFGGWLVRFFEKMIEAQELRARRHVQAHLRWQDDEVLKAAGYSAANIKRLRKGKFVSFPGARNA